MDGMVSQRGHAQWGERERNEVWDGIVKLYFFLLCRSGRGKMSLKKSTPRASTGQLGRDLVIL